LDLFKAIKTRRSVRSFKPQPIPSDLLEQIIESGIAAPSAGNMEPRVYILVQDPQVKRGLARAALGQSFIAEAPAVIVVCADTERSAARYGERGRRFYSLLDSAAAVQNILLAAHALGLGSCWVGAFDDGEVASVLSLPRIVRPVAILPIGYPAERPRATPRVHPREVVFREQYR